MVISVLMLIMIIILAAVAYGETAKNMKDVEFPPYVSNCPDFWEETDGGVCKNTYNLGVPVAADDVTISTMNWNGLSGDCNKYRWANNKGLTWDGITNMDKCNL